MDNSIQKISEVQTMSSLQIAELTGKLHRHILRDIRNLINQGVSETNFGLSSYQQEQPNGGYKEIPCYILTKKGCLILASGYDAVLREKIINRWEELELLSRNGGFQVPQSFSQALMLAARQAEELESQKKLIEAQRTQLLEKEAKIKEDAPKVVFSEAIIGSQSSILVGELAKMLTQNGYKIGQNRLFDYFRENGYFGKSGERYNIPNQQYVEMGLFEIKKNSFSRNGVMETKSTPKVTGKGQQYFINKFLTELKKQANP